MRRFKVKNRPFIARGLQYQDIWLYEKSVEVRVPNDQVIVALIREGKIFQAAAMITAKLLDQEQVITMNVSITNALTLGKDYHWKGNWVPIRRIKTPISPNGRIN